MKPKVISTKDGVIEFKSNIIQYNCSNCNKKSELLELVNFNNSEQELEIELNKNIKEQFYSECFYKP